MRTPVSGPGRKMLPAVVAALCGCLQPTQDVGERPDGGLGDPPDASIAACQPATCETLARNCGQTDDGCGGLLWCGTCAAGQACGSGGVANVCGCAPEVCEAPTGLSVRALGTGVEVAWHDNSPQELGHEIQRSTGGGAFVPLASAPANATAFVDATTRSGARYGYRVRAQLAIGATGWSTAAEVVLPETSRWQTAGGTPRQSGENPDEWRVPPLTFLWRSTPGGATGPVVVEGGRAFARAMLGATSGIVALDTSTGATLWTLPVSGASASAGDPAVLDGTVYFQVSANMPGSRVYALDAATGAERWSVPFSNQWQRFWSPIVVAGRLYLNGGSSGGLYGFDAATGSELFFSPLQQYDQWSPAFGGGQVVSYAGGTVKGHDPVTGAGLWTVNVPWVWSGYSMQTMPVAGEGLVYVVSRPTLYAISPATRAVAWSATSTNFAGTPAYSKGVVYGLAGGRLEARDGASGALLWTFAGDGNLVGAPVLAAGHAYVTSQLGTVFAVDLATRQQVWSAREGGPMAIAEGKLFFSGMGVRAYALAAPP